MKDEAMYKELEALQKTVADIDATIRRLGTTRNSLSNRISKMKRELKKSMTNNQPKQGTQVCQAE